jgi:hypothetical protein
VKNNIVTLSVLIFLCGVFLNTLTAQSNQKIEDKKWSRIIPDNKVIIPKNPDYKYISPPQESRRYLLDETDAVVQANYRVLPTTNTTQSELSIDIHPTNPNILFAGSNGTSWPVSGVYGTGVYWSTNASLNWTGSDNPSPYFGTGNSGDPAAVIGLNGNFYMGYIRNAGGQGVSVSTNNGSSWSSYTAGTDPSSSSDLLDKNHLWVDKKTGSPYANRVYDAWTHFVTGSASENQVVINYSSNNGVNWSSFVDLSTSLAPGSHAQGVNINTGPNGEVYATFAVYDNWGVGTYGEDAIGFAKSTDGGVTWTKARVYSAANFGIRGELKTTLIRVSSFPSMTVDRSGGARNGYIYICWPQKGVTPAGSDPDIVMIRSTNGGTTWSTPVRVNNDVINNGKDQYYPWCAVDQSTGQLHVVFYDNRNTTSDSTGVFMATSVDGGLTFDNFQISDANFKPKPISGLASGYQGDYIGITAANGKAYPFWADDRTGNYQAWTSVVTFGPSIVHTQLQNTENISGPYVVNAAITSINPLVPSSIKVYWGRGVGVVNDSLTMTNTGGSNYSASIPGNGSNATYNYYISATDNAGFKSTLPGGAPTNYFTFTAAADIIPPVIIHSAISNTPQIRWPINVSASVTDNLGVQSVQCEFRINGGGISTFSMPLVSSNNYQGTFTGTVNIGDVVEYRIKATDNSTNHNISYNPASGYNSFNIINVKGVVLVVDDDITLAARVSPEKGGTDNQYSIPLGASANLFNTTLTNAGYAVDQVTFASLNTATLSDYDVVILSGGVKESTQFNDVTKRTALVNYTLAGGKTLVEGGEVGYIYAKSGTTTDLHPTFRRNLLLDSVFVSDRTGANLQIVTTTHSIFKLPYVIPTPITVNNGGTLGYGARDEMTVLPGVAGISRIANWVGGTAANGGIFVYCPNNDTTVCRNVFFSFAVSMFANQTTAANLIENAVTYLMRDQVPTTKTLNLTAMIEGMWNGTTMVSDTVTVEVRGLTSPYTLVESKKIFLNSAGSGSAIFTTPVEGTPYYLVVKHRNSIETWSTAGVQFTAGNLTYDFTTAQNKGYGNNLKLVNGKWCIYSGDVNQDGLIDINDLTQVFIDNINGGIGYVATDLNGDLFTEVSDLNIVFVNKVLVISRQRPTVSMININLSE